jgi:hypothetical protein
LRKFITVVLVFEKRERQADGFQLKTGFRLAGTAAHRAGGTADYRARTHPGIAVEGEFTLPELARLTLEDQVFIVAFLRSHGSIKEMEQTFGVSYPTIKARLNRISGQLNFIETDPSPTRAEILARLKTGELTAEEAIRSLEALK